jgi:hypothetical protein
MSSQNALNGAIVLHVVRVYPGMRLGQMATGHDQAHQEQCGLSVRPVYGGSTHYPNEQEHQPKSRFPLGLVYRTIKNDQEHDQE